MKGTGDEIPQNTISHHALGQVWEEISQNTISHHALGQVWEEIPLNSISHHALTLSGEHTGMWGPYRLLSHVGSHLDFRCEFDSSPKSVGVQ